MTRNAFYVTTPIFYPNGVPHIGHAYNMLATDAIARFNRLAGRDVLHLTGTDEHGLKMQQTAQREGITSQQLADRNSQVFRELTAALNCAPDQFIRTTEPRHHRAVQAIWQRMEANGDIYLDTYAGWYSVRQEAFFDEKETTVGDDGVRREPLGSPVEWVEEESYFFRLSRYGEKLLAYYEAHPDFIAPPERRNEVMSFVKSGLKDLSVSRTIFDWGVPVPGNDKHVVYVWVDALTNYITAAGFPDENSPLWHYWPAVHIIGKDIVRFHAVYWPAFLMSAGIELPRRIFAHGFLLNRGEKMSKSVGNVVDPFEMIAEFGADAVRYFFLREVPFGQDGSYGREAIVNRVNADLANDFGNLAQRSLTMINKNCDGRVPTPGLYNKDDEALLASVDAAIATAQAAMDVQLIHEAVGALWEVVGEANRYFAAQEPWALRKTDFARMETVLYVTAEVIRRLAIPALAFIPASAARLLNFLSVGSDQWLLEFANESGKLRPGTMLPVPEPVFKRFERTKPE